MVAIVGNVVEERKKGAKMEWDKQQQHEEEEGGMYVKVMTDDQMELLRRQISAYATICEQLVQMHKDITAQRDSLSGVRLGDIYGDPFIVTGGHKITSRQRWTPTPVQLEILEGIFKQDSGTSSKQKIKEITSELMQHGQISETNVYNWFQNRRARVKRKQLEPLPNNGEAEVEIEAESLKEKKSKPENIHPHEKPFHDLLFQSPEISSDIHYLDPKLSKLQDTFLSCDGSKSSRSMDCFSLYENMLSNSRIDPLPVGKMEVPGTYDSFQTG